MDTNYFAEMITVARQNQRMTQEELAARLGVTPQAVSKWERGISLPDIGLLNGICSILQVSADEVLGGTVKRMEGKDESAKLHEIRMNSCAEPLLVCFGKDIIPSFVEGLKTTLIDDLRKQIATESGMLVPVIRIKDDIWLAAKEYCIKAYDHILFQGEITVIDTMTYQTIIKKLFQCCKENYATIINKQIVKSMIDTVTLLYPGVADGLIPDKISYLEYENVLVSILTQGGSIRNHIKIIEYLENEMILHGNKEIESIAKGYIEQEK